MITTIYAIMLAIYSLVAVSASSKCSDIIDIYYSEKTKDFAYSKECPYTITKVCDECPTYYISRDHYDDWAAKFYEYGSTPPHAKRFDKDKIIYPKND